MHKAEIEVPKELRQFMLKDAKETLLGQKNGANKQYRYGNLHIREYDDKFLVHMDKIDPQKNPLGHLVVDAPEILAGVACAILGGKVASTIFTHKNTKTTILSSVISGYLGYIACKKIKDFMR